MPDENELTEEEILELARQRFLESSKIKPEIMEEFIEFNKTLNTRSVEEMSKKFTI